jgi:hypothetical protein
MRTYKEVIIMFKRKPDYEKIIKERMNKLQEARMAYFQKVQSNLNDVYKGDTEAFQKMQYNTQCMNQFTYEIRLLSEILDEARA